MTVSPLFWLSVQKTVGYVFDIVPVLAGPEDRMHTGGDILQDCSSERCSLTKTESDPACDLSLPGEKLSVRDPKQEKDPQTLKKKEEEEMKMERSWN